MILDSEVMKVQDAYAFIKKAKNIFVRVHCSNEKRADYFRITKKEARYRLSFIPTDTKIACKVVALHNEPDMIIESLIELDSYRKA
jgi:hypothetical protein